IEATLPVSPPRPPPRELRPVPSPPSVDPNLAKDIAKETEWRGSFLRKIREAQRVSLEEMSGATKITKNYLLAIEEENFSRLPATVYIRGFVIQIAKVLKLPHDKVASAYLSRVLQA